MHTEVAKEENKKPPSSQLHNKNKDITIYLTITLLIKIQPNKKKLPSPMGLHGSHLRMQQRVKSVLC